MHKTVEDEVNLRDLLVRNVGHEGVEELFRVAQHVRYDVGEMIFSTGDPATGIILIKSGRVEISGMSTSGKKTVYAHMAAGEMLGEIAALDGQGRSADAMAATAVTGRFVARQNLMGFITARPALAQSVIVALCQKTRNATEMVLTRSAPDAEVRLARTLIKMFDVWGTPQPDGTFRLTEQFSQQDIGDFCGLARENVSRTLANWIADGLLQKDGRQLILLDRSRLLGIIDA